MSATIVASMVRLSRDDTIKEAIAACKRQKIENPANNDDETYNRAIDRCVEALRGLG